MSLGNKVFAAPARLWMNWPLWGGLLATLLLAKHVWVLFAPAEHAVPGTTIASQSAQAEQLFGTVNTTTASASLNGIRPIGIFASRKNGFAVMMTDSGQVGVGLGSEVVPGVRLVETHPDHVILERNGVKQRVDLSRAPAATDGITPASSMQPSPGRSTAEPMLNRQLLDQLTPEQQRIMQQQQRELIRGRP